MTIDDAKSLGVGDLVCLGNDGIAGYIVVRAPYPWGKLIVVDLIDRFRSDAPIIPRVRIEQVS